MEDHAAIMDFLGLAIDQELEALAEGDRDDVAWADVLEDAQYSDGELTLADGRCFKITVQEL